MTDVIDPEKLTKEQLFQALTKHGVEDIPTKKARKAVFVDLYLKHIHSETETTNRDESNLHFSEDDEIEIRDTSQKPKSNQRRPNSIMPPVRKSEPPTEVQLMSNAELADQLRARGVDVGPIIASTRKVYERKLGELLQGGPPQQISVSEEEEYMEEEPYEEEVVEEEEPEIVPKSSSSGYQSLIRPRLREAHSEQEMSRYTSRSYTSSGSSATASKSSKPADKKGMSIVAKLLILVVLAVLVYLVVVNMEGTRPKPQALSEDPEAGKAQTQT